MIPILIVAIVTSAEINIMIWNGMDYKHMYILVMIDMHSIHAAVKSLLIEMYLKYHLQNIGHFFRTQHVKCGDHQVGKQSIDVIVWNHACNVR